MCTWQQGDLVFGRKRKRKKMYLYFLYRNSRYLFVSDSWYVAKFKQLDYSCSLTSKVETYLEWSERNEGESGCGGCGGWEGCGAVWSPRSAAVLWAAVLYCCCCSLRSSRAAVLRSSWLGDEVGILKITKN